MLTYTKEFDSKLRIVEYKVKKVQTFLCWKRFVLNSRRILKLPLNRNSKNRTNNKEVFSINISRDDAKAKKIKLNGTNRELINLDNKDLLVTPWTILEENKERIVFYKCILTTKDNSLFHIIIFIN